MSDVVEINPRQMPCRIASTDEPWTTVALENGTVLRVRLNITEVFVMAAPDGVPLRDAAGKPAYGVNWVVATHVIEPKGMPDGQKAN